MKDFIENFLTFLLWAVKAMLIFMFAAFGVVATFAAFWLVVEISVVGFSIGSILAGILGIVGALLIFPLFLMMCATVIFIGVRLL